MPLPDMTGVRPQTCPKRTLWTIPWLGERGAAFRRAGIASTGGKKVTLSARLNRPRGTWPGSDPGRVPRSRGRKRPGWDLQGRRDLAERSQARAGAQAMLDEPLAHRAAVTT